MIRKIQRQWFEVWGQEEAQNRLLKYLLTVLGGLTALLIVALTIMSIRNPPVVIIDPETSVILTPMEPDGKTLERELVRILKKYVTTRNNWTWVDIDAQTKAASAYVASDFREKFLLATQEQIRLAKEKQVSQKMYPEDPKIDLKDKKAVVVTERILIVNGIRASSTMTFELGFVFGDRTALNPEGIYITSEKLQQPTGS